ncbi:hypothetical protein nvc1_070 [Namao virus]|nr:hypothetical protein nvc1_070 [Namao virus]
MYINKIDELIDQALDVYYTERIPVDQIETIFDKGSIQIDEHKTYIYNLIIKYVFIYIILNKHTELSLEEFIRFFIHLKANYEKYIDQDINKFINYYGNIAKDFISFCKEIQQGKTPPQNKYKEMTKILQGYDQNLVVEILSGQTEEIQKYNFIKLLVIGEIYKKRDKKNIFCLIEKTELSSLEQKQIEIIYKKDSFFQFTNLELLFSNQYTFSEKKYLSQEIFNMLTESYSLKAQKDLTCEKKINFLFKYGVLTPIVDDLFRYHKDTDIYLSKSTTEDTSVKQARQKKDNTKIKYIVTKINSAVNLYNPENSATEKETILKTFYPQMAYNNAIIYNEFEELNIIKKIRLQDFTFLSNNVYYTELSQIRNYPYISFKHLSKDGFFFSSLSNFFALRACNFIYKDDTRFNIKEKNIDWRMSNKSRSNVVGVAISKMKNYLPCYKLKQFVSVDTIHNNGYLACLKLIKKLYKKKAWDDKTVYYWMFNKEHDLFKSKYLGSADEIIEGRYFKFLVCKLYDAVMESIFLKYIKRIHKIDPINYSEYKLCLQQIKKGYLNMAIPSSIWERYQYYLYLKVKSESDTRDQREDQVIDISELEKLPRHSVKEKDLQFIYLTSEDFRYSEQELQHMKSLENAYCQHIIIWESIHRYKNKDPNYFKQLLFDFIKQYITEKSDGTYICKSCFQLVNIKKYTTDAPHSKGVISIITGFNIELETVPEYAKYNKVIKNIDKIIEKLCYGGNIMSYIGSGAQPKFKRQNIIRNLIDCINLNYKSLYKKSKDFRQQRLDHISSVYNISKDHTELYMFELDNEVFSYSTAEKDKYKRFKINNILIYLLFLFVSEATPSQILYFVNDKFINLYIFDKISGVLFNRLKIVVNTRGETRFLSDYKLLCYYIYYIASHIIKYNMWFKDDSSVPAKNQQNLISHLEIYKYIIHTFVDFTNLILETVVNKKTPSYFYEMTSARFFNQVNGRFSPDASEDILKEIHAMNKKNIQTSQNVTRYVKIKVNNIVPHKHVYENDYLSRSVTDEVRDLSHIARDKISLTSDFKSQEFKDVLSGHQLYEMLVDLQTKKHKKLQMIYTVDGIKRNVPLEETKSLPASEIKKMIHNIQHYRIYHDQKVLDEMIKRQSATTQLLNHKIDYFLKDHKKLFNNTIDNVVDAFITDLIHIVGNNITFPNSDKKIYLDQDVYTINHDHLGNMLSKPLVFLESENRVSFKKFSRSFNQDIYYFYDKVNNVVYYYSFIELYLLGYKEYNKNIKYVNNTNCYLKIERSIKYKLLYMGYNYIHYRLNEEDGETDSQYIEIIQNITRTRIQNLKNIVFELNRILYQTYYHEQTNNLHPISALYISKIQTFNLSTDTYKLFKDLDTVVKMLYYNNTEDVDEEYNIKITTLPNEHRYLSVFNILKFAKNDQILLFYIMQEIQKLIEINDDIYTKGNLIQIFIMTVDKAYNDYNMIEKIKHNIYVKKFILYMNESYLSRTGDIYDINTESMEFESDEAYNEYLEESYDEREKEDALDVSMELNEPDDETGENDVLYTDRDI